MPQLGEGQVRRKEAATWSALQNEAWAFRTAMLKGDSRLGSVNARLSA